MPEDKLPIPQFAAKIKAKYPEYKDVNDTLLVKRIVEKYPEYEESVDLSGLEDPVKKKETASPLGGKVGSSVGRLDVGAGITEIDDKGKPVGGALGGGLGTGLNKKPSIYIPETNIEEYNASMKSKLGLPKLNLGSDLPQIKRERDAKEYQELRNIEETEIKPFEASVFTGTVQPSQIKDLANKPYGKKLVNDVLRQYAPEAGGLSLDENVFGSDKNAEQVANVLQQKFRLQGIEAQNQYLYNLDKEVYDNLNGLKRTDVNVSGGTGGAATGVSEANFPSIDTNSPVELGKALEFLSGGDGTYFELNGKRLTQEEISGLSRKINEKLFAIKAGEPIHPEILSQELSGKLLNAVSNVDAEWKKNIGYSPEQKQQFIQKDFQYAEEGLNFLRDANRSAYNNIVGGILKKEKIADTDYEQLVSIGKRLESEKKFRNGDFLVDDNRDFRTYQTLKAEEAGALSEKIKQMGYKNKAKVADNVIVKAAIELGIDPNSQRVLDIRRDEASGGYGIVKGGGLTAFMRGLAQPIKSIQSTFQAIFNDPTTTYLNSKRYDYGDQIVPDKEGNYTNVLPSERGYKDIGNIFNKILEGTGQLTTQVLTSRLGGQLISAPYRAATLSVPRAALTGAQATNIAAYGGGGLSTLAQTYGPSYIDFLNKTGNPNKASFMALVDATAQSVIEVGVLPDVKLAESMKDIWQNAKRNLATDIMKVVEKGGGKEAAQPFIKKFAQKSAEIWGKEVIGEEVLQNLTNYLTEAFFSPKTAQSRNLSKETVNVIKDASLSMAVPVIVGGFAAGKSNRKLTQDALNTAAQNFDTFADAIENGRLMGVIAPQDADTALEIIKVHQQSLDKAPKQDANGEAINAARQIEYAFQNTVEEVAKSKLAKETDEVQQEPLKKQIEEAKEIKRKIFNGTEISTLPKEEKVEQPTIDQDRVLGDEELVVDEDFISKPIELDPNLPEGYVLPTTQLTPEQQIIQQAIDNNEVEGMFLDMAKAAVADPQQAKQLLDEAKSQATGQVAGELGSARSGVEKAWGKTIADFVAPIQKEKPKEKLKLAGKFVDTEKADNAFEEIKSLGKLNELNENQVVIDNVKVNVERDGGKIWLKEISAIEQGKGDGTRVLNKIKQVADKNGIDIVLHPTKIKNTTEKQLIDWYKSNGFEEYTQGRLIYRTKEPQIIPAKAGSGGVVVGEEMRGYKFPDENEIYDIIESEEGRHGGEFIGEDGKFQTEDDARRYVKEVSDHLGGIAAQENIPIYRVVQADEVDLTPYGIGESWTFDLDAAKEFAKMNLSGSPKDWKIISAIVPKENVDWEQAVRQYTNFSDIMSAESEFELPIEPNSKLLNVSVSDYKKAKSIEQPKAETPTQETTPVSTSGIKKSNRGVVKKARGIEDLTEPRDIVMQYFAGGNKINPSAIKELFGGKDERLHFGKGTGGEQKSKISLLKGDAPSIKELAHKLWEASGGLEDDYRYTDRDFRDAIESVLQDHNSPTSMSIELVDKYINKAVKQELTDQEAKDISDGLIRDITKYVEELPENQQNELIQILSKYQDKFGFIDWDAVEKDSNGFDPDILSLTIETQEALDGIIQKNLKSGQSEFSDASRQSSRQEKGEEKVIPQKKPEEPTTPPTTQAKELADKSVGKYEKKAREIADKIQKSELPDWLKADLPDGTKKAGASYDQLKKALADAVIEMGKLLDKGVEYSQAIKQAVKDLVSLQGEENRDTIEKGFEKYYTDQTQQQPPPPQTPKQEPKEVGGDIGGKKKAVLNRLYNAKNVPQSAKEGFEREGLTYKPKSQKEAAEIAKSILDEFGVDEAVELADSSSMFEGDVRTLIFAEALDKLQGEENAARWAEVAIAMDKFERSSGRAASAVNYFYKNNPYGVQLKEEADRKEAFDKWATSKKEKSWKEFFEEFKKDPEFNQYFKEQVYEELKKERAKSRQGRIKKVRDIFAKAKASVSGKGAVYSSIIPPKIITGALDVMEKAYEAGEAVVEVVQRAIDYINKEFGTSWDSEKFREEWEDKLKEPTKAPLTEEEFKKKVLDRFRNRLKGLSDKQRDEVVRRMFDKVVNAGALEYDDLRDIIADVLGYGKLTAEEGKRLQELVKKRNAVGEAAKKAQEERTDKALEEYRLSEIEAGKAARELQELLWNKPDIIKRLTSIMQLSTLGIPSLINNPVYNFFNQLGVRFPVGLINSTIDKVGQFVANKMGKNYVREYNIFDGQAEFWAKLGVGSKEAVQQLFTGLNRQDYIQKEYYGQQIRPMRAIRDLIRWKAGEKKLTKAQVIDKALQASVGIPAEVVARFLNIGDKPQRFAAEGSQAAAFAKALGLKDIDRKLFIEFPKEEAYRAYKAQGLSDEAAATKSEYIKEAIIKEGQRSTFQQDNLLNDAITRFFGAFGGKDSGTANLVKTLTVSPYIKIPTNAFWSYYNLVNPEVAILQSFYHAGRAKMLSNKGDEVAAKLQMREARYWLAHAFTGMAMRGLVVFLVQAGIFVAGNTGDESKKEREAESFFEQPGTLNISKLWALMRGEDPKKVKNGVLVSNRWFGQFGTLGNSIMRKWEDMTPEQRENQQQFWNIAFGGMELDALKEMENGIFANTSSLLDVVNTGDFSRYGLNTINMFTNILQPASIAQFNRASLNEVPQAKGDTFLEKLNQNFAQRSSLYRKAFDVQLKYKRDMWGEPMPKGGNWLSRLFGISRVDEKKSGRPMFEDYLRTADIGFLTPSVLPVLNGKKLNTKQHALLEMYIGQSRKAIALPFINDEAVLEGFDTTYSQMTDEEKKAALQYMYELGRRNGLEKFYQDFPEFMPKDKTDEEEDLQEKMKEFRKSIKD